MANLIFGTAGIPVSTQPPTTLDGIRHVAELGLGAMEVEFVQGIYLDETKARQVAAAAESRGIMLSAHAPYFINLNAREPRKIKMGMSMLRHAAHIAAVMGARSVVFHAGFYMGDSAEKTFQAVKRHLAEVLATLKKEGIDVTLRPEVSGRLAQFGSLQEVLRLCRELPALKPAIDFAHWHARSSGGYNSYDEFMAVLEQTRGELGDNALSDVHFHIAGIAYGARGERKHLNLEDSDLNYGQLIRALAASSVSGLVICESPNREEDALLLMAGYKGLAGGTRAR